MQFVGVFEDSMYYELGFTKPVGYLYLWYVLMCNV